VEAIERKEIGASMEIIINFFIFLALATPYCLFETGILIIIARIVGERLQFSKTYGIVFFINFLQVLLSIYVDVLLERVAFLDNTFSQKGLYLIAIQFLLPSLLGFLSKVFVFRKIITQNKKFYIPLFISSFIPAILLFLLFVENAQACIKIGC